jgi:hypothetical protein
VKFKKSIACGALLGFTNPRSGCVPEGCHRLSYSPLATPYGHAHSKQGPLSAPPSQTPKQTFPAPIFNFICPGDGSLSGSRRAKTQPSVAMIRGVAKAGQPVTNAVLSLVLSLRKSL